MHASGHPSALDHLRQVVKRLPPVGAYLEARLHEHFLAADGFAGYWGAYESFAQARAALPPSRGYDEPGALEAAIRIGLHRIHPYDYPVIHWLGQAFAQGARSVYDIGGSVGVHFFAYRRCLAYPPGLRWLVAERPATARRGRAGARGPEAAGLGFVETLEPREVEGQVWLSSGALQYIEEPGIAELLREARRPPECVILNKLPLHEGADFVVTQNLGGGGFAPVWVWNRAAFVRRIEACGYRLVDAWDVPERPFYLPLHPERCFDCFSGLCFHPAAHD